MASSLPMSPTEMMITGIGTNNLRRFVENWFPELNASVFGFVCEHCQTCWIELELRPCDCVSINPWVFMLPFNDYLAAILPKWVEFAP